jgi:hypothetical protein
VPSPGAAGPLDVESEGEIRYLDDKKALASHETSWTRLSNAALRYEESRKFLAQVAKDFRTDPTHEVPSMSSRFAEEDFRKATASNPNLDCVRAPDAAAGWNSATTRPPSAPAMTTASS